MADTSFGRRAAPSIKPDKTSADSGGKGRVISGLIGVAVCWTLMSVMSSGTPTDARLEKPRSAYEAAAQSRNDDTIAALTAPVGTASTLCTGRYPLDYQMRDVCIQSQEEARLDADTIGIDQDVKILCARRYNDDWQMYILCAKQQMAAKTPNTAKPDRPDFDISRKCEQQWRGDFNMQEYCIKQQDEAHSRAGSWIDDQIAIMCTSEWPTDWQMFMYCVDQQSNAKSRLN